MIGPVRVTASPVGKRDVSCHGRAGLAGVRVARAAIADERLRDLGGNDPRAHTARLEYNPPVISGLPGIWYGEP
jgi:hypothetical protein